MRQRKMILAAATAILMITGATAATAAGADASSAGSAGKKPAPHGPAKPGKPGKPCMPSPDSRLEKALRDVKMILGPDGGKVTDPKVVAVFAKDMGMTTAQARKTLVEIFGSDHAVPKPGDKNGKPGDKTPGWTGADLAKVLGVSQAKAQAAMDSLNKLAKAGNGRIDETSPAYKAIAAKLGVTPQQLTKAIIQLKAANNGKPGEPGKPGNGKPVPCKRVGGKI